MSEAIPNRPGLYQIIVAKLGQPELDRRDALTRWEGEGEQVTILPLGGSGIQPSDQLWYIEPVFRDGGARIIITKESKFRPPTSLTYKGWPEPESGERVIVHIQEFATSWEVGIAPGHRESLRVADTDLGIAFGDLTIHPPHLVLGKDNQLSFHFKFIRPSD